METMKQIRLLASYNLWADRVLCARLDQLNDEQLDHEVKSSFSSIRKTLGHMFDAERIWLSRLDGRSLKDWPSHQIEKFGSRDLLKESETAFDYVISLNEQDLNMICTYSNSNGKIFNNVVEEILMHLFNHATYHRGQIISMLRSLGEKDLPSTDLITYLRSLES